MNGCCGRNGGEFIPEPVPAMPGSSGVLELLPPGPMGLPKTWRVCGGEDGSRSAGCGGVPGVGAEVAAGTWLWEVLLTPQTVVTTERDPAG